MFKYHNMYVTADISSSSTALITSDHSWVPDTEFHRTRVRQEIAAGALPVSYNRSHIN